MARYLFVVSRQHVGLYEYLLERFATDQNVTVTLDRRVAERRRAPGGRNDDRRLGDRREPVSPEDDLAPRGARSHRIVTLEG
jgi:hypothetical protein